jgi:hypothetical protein
MRWLVVLATMCGGFAQHFVCVEHCSDYAAAFTWCREDAAADQHCHHPHAAHQHRHATGHRHAAGHHKASGHQHSSGPLTPAKHSSQHLCLSTHVFWLATTPAWVLTPVVSWITADSSMADEACGQTAIIALRQRLHRLDHPTPQQACAQFGRWLV